MISEIKKKKIDEGSIPLQNIKNKILGLWQENL